MTAAINFEKIMTAWAAQMPAVSGLVIIGSRERAATDAIEYADDQSDWDFQVITSRPQIFANRDWTRELTGAKLLAYAARSAVIGGVPKIGAVFAGAEVDLVIIPEKVLRKVKFYTTLGRHRHEGWTRRRLQDLAEVVRPGWRFLKGAGRWGSIYDRAVAEVIDPRLSDEGARQLAEGFVCDYVWTLRKIARGELRTAQRMLHRELAEVNFQLLHELRWRRGEKTYTKSRRIERITGGAELDSVTVELSLNPASLLSAVEKSAATCRELVKALVGESWHWPDLG